ncbi:MAG TPA: thiamine pyrophosphate-binding protein [Acidimicrobiia bacterium]|nr:thiamine pyrophosphate-binding protein [Acidimicrobiia bacterium]
MPSGRDILFDLLADEGVKHVFGNPGSTELPFIDELAVRPEFEYVLALQENTAVGMADGYAQATGRPAFVNLHTSAGLGGGVGNLTNALANRTPLVVTAGQQDRRHLIADPLLSGDLTGLARAVSKWQHEVRHLGELGTTLRRAFKDASTPPTGPVFVSIPMDVLDESDDTLTIPGWSRVELGSVAGGVDECADLLAGVDPDEVCVVFGDEVAIEGAIEEAVSVADALGCTVFSAPLYSNINFPTDHPQWAGMLIPFANACHAQLSEFRRVFWVGAQAVLVYPYTPGPAVPDSVELIHLDHDPAQIGRTYPVVLGMAGGIKATLVALAGALAGRVDAARAAKAREARADRQREAMEGFEQTALDRYDQVPMNAMATGHALAKALPEHGVVVDEAVTSGIYVRGFQRTAEPGSYFFCRGGGLGWGMPAALGVKLARPDRPVLCAVGDGSAMYAVQSLWTAASEGIPVLFAVFNNRQYKILKDNLATSMGRSAESGRYVAMDLDEPPVDYVGLAQSMGVEAMLVEKASDVTDAAASALDSGKPWLLELPITAG